jgi:hypothetical protein
MSDLLDPRSSRRVQEKLLPEVENAGRWTGQLTLRRVDSSVRTRAVTTAFNISPPAAGQPPFLAAVYHTI